MNYNTVCFQISMGNTLLAELGEVTTKKFVMKIFLGKYVFAKRF